MIWRALFGLVLTRLDAERAHRLGMAGLRLLGHVPRLRGRLGPRDPRLRMSAFGLALPSPLGLAAGFDKDAEAVAGFAALGFGLVEVGTVTASAQTGNPRPRMARLPADRALVNRMGFNNHGAAVAADHLRDRPSGLVVGVNIGKTKLAASAATDYAASAALLAPHADYLVLNVSSPNTPGLRDLQAVAELRTLIHAVRPVIGSTPLLVKIAPDLSDADVDAVADLALEERLDGLIATNTTIARTGLASDAAAVATAGAGGLSGAPLAARSLAVLRRLRARVGDRVVLVAAGGVESADDVWERLEAGASIVQGYTGFVYGGPLWAHRIHRDLLARLDREGVPSLAALVGRAAPASDDARGATGADGAIGADGGWRSDPSPVSGLESERGPGA